MTRRWTRLIAGCSTGASVAAALLMMPGCNIVGPAFYFIHGPEKTPALYTLDPMRSVVVFVDDRSNKLPRRDLRIRMAEATQQTLAADKASNDIIDARGAFTATSQDKYGKPLTIAEIGKAVNAQTVIYTVIDEFSLSPDGQAIAPNVTIRVKVVDAETGKRLWPDEPEGHTLSLKSIARSGMAPSTTADLYQLQEKIVVQGGVAVGQLFVEHEAGNSAQQRF